MSVDVNLESYLNAIDAAVARRRQRYQRLTVSEEMADDVMAAEHDQLQRCLKALEHPHAQETKTELIADLLDLIACLYSGPARAIYRARTGRYYVAYSNAAVRPSVVHDARDLGVLRPLWPDAPWLDCWRLAEGANVEWYNKMIGADISESAL